MFYKTAQAAVLAVLMTAQAAELGTKKSATCTTTFTTFEECACYSKAGHTKTKMLDCDGCALSIKTKGPINHCSITCPIHHHTAPHSTTVVHACKTEVVTTTTDTAKHTKKGKSTSTPTTTQSTIPLTSTVSSESHKGTPLCSIVVTEYTEAGCTVTAAKHTVTSLTNCQSCKITTTTQALGVRGSSPAPSCTEGSSTKTIIDHSATSTATACETAAGPV